MHPFARSPIRERQSSTTSALFPGSQDGRDDRREEEEDALRMMAYGEGTLPGSLQQDGGRAYRAGRGDEGQASGSGSGSGLGVGMGVRSFNKRVPRSPPPQGPPRESPPVATIRPTSEQKLIETNLARSSQRPSYPPSHPSRTGRESRPYPRAGRRALPATLHRTLRLPQLYNHMRVRS